MAEAARNAHEKIMANRMQTPIANERAARKVCFDLYETAAKPIDAARKRAIAEIQKIEAETHSPPEPKHVMGSTMEAEIRSALAAMSQKQRASAIAEAIESCDDVTVGAAMHGPPLLTGLSQAEREVIRHNWRARRFPNEIDRVQRLNAALADLDRGGTSLLQHVASLTDAKAIKEAEEAEQAAHAASKVA